MSDWAFDHMGIILLIVCGSFFVLAGFAINSAITEDNRLLAQCMADGHKEYECHAMLDDHSQVVPMPVIIPSGR